MVSPSAPSNIAKYSYITGEMEYRKWEGDTGATSAADPTPAANAAASTSATAAVDPAAPENYTQSQNQYSDYYQGQYSNQYQDQYSNQYQNQYSSQYQDQYASQYQQPAAQPEANTAPAETAAAGAANDGNTPTQGDHDNSSRRRRHRHHHHHREPDLVILNRGNMEIRRRHY
ncbi:hypothetical protein F4809DRAFT_595175 [Biscogniauxia mediterranea]|nr:hypothetical protein F4809DRAFT_595175 [Biscogniauxia mediterranea]